MAVSVLTYLYVEDIRERRKPVRDDHLAHVARFSAERGLVLAGATGDPPTGALFVFEHPADAVAEAEAFMAGDPYVAADLVSDSAIEPWTIVARRPFAEIGR